MRLSVRPLNGTTDVNTFEYVSEVGFTQGDVVRFFFQLVDVSKDTALQQYKPAGRRYVPAVGATLQVSLLNQDEDKAIADRVCVQPFVGDASIWYVDIAAADAVLGTVSMTLKLTEGSKVTRGRVNAVLDVHSIVGV